ncbi:hypothetical protein EPUL_004411, partial [Erysiphe pulchra]
MYACVDDNILNWYRGNQDTIRSDLYSGVMDALRHDHSPENIGKPKRGLPHVHILLYLHEDDVPRTSEQVDELVRAQIFTDDPELAEIFKKQLTHDHCGPGFPNAPCYRVGKRSKGYLKPFCETTILADNSYPVYARLNSGITWGNDQFTFDNRWAVPYNPYLIKKYGAHINVEVAKGVHAIKYLAKYVYKGSDRASIVVHNRHDEIKMTLQGRYISPAQAIWRLMAYDTLEEKPAVLLLITWKQIVAAIGIQSSTFSDWMRYNAARTDGRDLLYTDFPLFYTHHKNRGWQIRKKGQTVGRMPIAVFKKGERFYLRTLLTIKRGAQSFRDLYTVNGITYDVPSAACRALGLTFGDSGWYSLFNEIKDLSTASSLRQTFAVGMAHCIINDPQNVCDHFREAFTDDCLFRIRNLGGHLNPPSLEWNEEQCRYDYGLWLFGENLRHLNIDWRVARLRGPIHNWTTIEENPLMTEALNFDREAEGTNYRDSLTKLSLGQRAAYESIVETIDNGIRTNTFFIQGPAGTGKIFLYNTICSKYRSEGKIFLCVASSGIASLLLKNGGNAHSMFKIPVECSDTAVCDISGQSNLAKLLRNTSLMIWDEVTLQLKQNFGALDRTLQSLLNNRDIFGGIPMVDFARILPVVKRGGKDEIISAYNMRVVTGEENQRFASWLSEIPYTPSLHVNSVNQSTQFNRANVVSIFRDRAILSSRNDNVNRFNNDMAQLRSAPFHEYFVVDVVIDVIEPRALVMRLGLSRVRPLRLLTDISLMKIVIRVRGLRSPVETDGKTDGKTIFS